LIVDEVSMVGPDIMDCMHHSLMKIKRNDLPFGGVPMIFVGDILQLPPVVQETEVGVFYTHRYDSPNFYSADVFKRLDIYPIQLKKVFRQSDLEFIDVLSRIRVNREHRESVALLNRRCFRDRDKNTDDSIFLVPTNAAARSINESKLDAIDGTLFSFIAQFTGDMNPGKMRFPAPETLNLKKGARVIFVHNNKPYWHNGTQGEVVEIEEDSLRVKIIESGNIVPVSRHTWEKLKYTYDYDSREIKTETIGSYTQFPVALGWAITIHKSQGMTLDRVHVDLGGGAFCSGQTYVALSRCKTIDGLSLAQPIAMSDVQVDHATIEFCSRLGLLEENAAQQDDKSNA
jgi:ATP-dependent exoDNAse (exonuclease V) alpha subunit